MSKYASGHSLLSLNYCQGVLDIYQFSIQRIHPTLLFLPPTTFRSSDPLYSSTWGPWKFPNHKVFHHLFAVNYLPPNQLYWSNIYSPFKMYNVSWHSILNKVSSSFKHSLYFFVSILRLLYSPCIYHYLGYSSYLISQNFKPLKDMDSCYLCIYLLENLAV